MAIRDFVEDVTNSGNWHSAIGAIRLAAKYAAETVIRVQYPRDIERGLPAGVKGLAKCVVGLQPAQLQADEAKKENKKESKCNWMGRNADDWPALRLRQNAWHVEFELANRQRENERAAA